MSLSRLQQINLFQPEFRHQPDPLSLQVMVLTCLLALFLLAGSGGYGWLALENQRSVIAALENHHAQLQAQLAVLRQDLGKDQSLDQHINDLEQQVSDKTSNAQQLELLLSDRNRVAQQFAALSKLQIPGVWLTTIFLGEQNELHGTATRVDLVPEYLTHIASLPPFNNLRFDDILITHHEQSSTQVNFILLGQATLVQQP